MLSTDWEHGVNVNTVILLAERSKAAFFFFGLKGSICICRGDKEGC